MLVGLGSKPRFGFRKSPLRGGVSIPALERNRYDHPIQDLHLAFPASSQPNIQPPPVGPLSSLRSRTAPAAHEGVCVKTPVWRQGTPSGVP